MYRSTVAVYIVATLGILAGPLAQAQFAGTEFSAEIVQRGPEGQESTGKMYVGRDLVRTDMTQGGQKMIHIVDNNRQTEWLLYPSQRSYMEMPGRGADDPAPSKIRPNNPCEGLQGVSCENLGKEQVSGRQTTKWQLTFEHQGQTKQGTQWIDDERKIPLRQVMPDGQTTELRMLGIDNLDGRTVEKWEMTSTRGDQAPQRAYQWFDPKLQLAIREEFPGGYVREMRNIREGTQPAGLFSIPAGYRQMSLPSADTPQMR